MTAEELKAKEIVEKFYQVAPELFGTGKAMTYAVKCAIIEVNEIINALESFGYQGAFYDDFETNKMVNTSENNPTEYWRTVKSHLLKM